MTTISVMFTVSSAEFARIPVKYTFYTVRFSITSEVMLAKYSPDNLAEEFRLIPSIKPSLKINFYVESPNVIEDVFAVLLVVVVNPARERLYRLSVSDGKEYSSFTVRRLISTL